MDKVPDIGYNAGMKAKDVIIYTDLDGTALTDWDRGPVVAARNLEAIKAFVDAGGVFSVASGRRSKEVNGFFAGVEFKAPLVCCNGGIIYDAKSATVLQKITLPKSSKKECADYVKNRKNLWLVAATNEQNWQVTFADKEKDTPIGDLQRPFLPVERFLEEDDIIKMVYVTPAGGEGMNRIIEETSRFESSDLVSGFQSSPRYFEMVERSVSKANGIRLAIKYAHMEKRTLVCIGDYYNDLPMLETADISACPSNGDRRVKDFCDYITCDNNHGAVADLIQMLGLI